MEILNVRNAHQALPAALKLLEQHGVLRSSRDGDVVVAPWPVVTEYRFPMERVVFWEQRDANPFFHLYEALWMLAGRRDLAGLTRYVKQFGRFSDDGITVNGAYGYRWRQWFDVDQVAQICLQLRTNANDRRCVLQMWDARRDLGSASKDVPCNTQATFQVGLDGRVDMTVFCRSNDIIMGAYGANAVHFGFLLEHVAARVGRHPGMYRQVSVNWHAYTRDLAKLSGFVDSVLAAPFSVQPIIPDPYPSGQAEWAPLRRASCDYRTFEHNLLQLLDEEARGVFSLDPYAETPLLGVAAAMLRAHAAYRGIVGEARYQVADDILAAYADQRNDWIQAGRAWVERRRVAHERAAAVTA